MARPKKATVDYFPHVTKHGKTLFILENIWGNDGYAVWFKVLERLGSSENHVINMNDAAESAFLSAYCKVKVDILTAILDQCAALNAINPVFWRKKLIYSDNFVKNVADAYRKRTEKLPSDDIIKSLYFGLFREETGFPSEETPHISEFPAEETGKGKGKGKGKEKDKEKKKPVFVKPSIDEVRSYCQKRRNNVNPELWVNHYESNGWKVGKNHMKDWQAAVRTWELQNLSPVSEQKAVSTW